MFANVKATPCRHLYIVNGICQHCGDCKHAVILNGTCAHCGIAPYDIPAGQIVLPTKLCDDAETS